MWVFFSTFENTNLKKSLWIEETSIRFSRISLHLLFSSALYPHLPMNNFFNPILADKTICLIFIFSFYVYCNWVNCPYLRNLKIKDNAERWKIEFLKAFWSSKTDLCVFSVLIELTAGSKFKKKVILFCNVLNLYQIYGFKMGKY